MRRDPEAMDIRPAATITAEGFQKKLGYICVGEEIRGSDRAIPMEKRLVPDAAD